MAILFVWPRGMWAVVPKPACTTPDGAGPTTDFARYLTGSGSKKGGKTWRDLALAAFWLKMIKHEEEGILAMAHTNNVE